MAKKYDIDIDSYIGDWYCSKREIKNQLSKMGDKEVTVRVSSLGGDVNTALDIAAQFEANGNIVCDFYAFNASAATVLTLGAKKIRMHENAMYLIHKALMWVDEFGYMNEDGLEELIQKLKAKQENSAIVTLNIAKMYAKKSGKPIKDVLNLMKEEKWLDAETAKEWGFVDEVFSGAIPAKKADDIVEMLNRAELPIPENVGSESEEEPEPITRKDFLNEIISGIKNIFSNNKPETQMDKKIIQMALIAAILNVENFESVDDKIELTAEQMTDIENALSGKDAEIEALKQDIFAKETEIENLKTEVKNAKNAPGDTTRNVNKETDDIDDDDDGVELFDNAVIESAKNLFDALP